MDSDADSDNYEYLYDEEDESKHDNLVHKVLSLNKAQHLKKASRTEPTLQISEFNLVNSGSVNINNLTKALKGHGKGRTKIVEKIKTAAKARTLPKPLEKPQAEQIRRGVSYQKARLQLDRWEATVTANRALRVQNFPLDSDVKLDKKNLEDFGETWRIQSDLDKALEEVQPKVIEYNIALEEEKFPLTMQEMMERRKEAAKLRAFQGYKETKARRQNKIKSKRYHRVQKRERIKQKLKEFELLQKTNPEEALEKLNEIDKARVEERFSLRHKSTGQWARSKQFRAKYDKETRQELAQQLTISRDLTQKLQSNESEDEEEEVEDEDMSTSNIDLSLPPQAIKPIIDEELNEHHQSVETNLEDTNLKALKTILIGKPDSDIDPKKYIKVQPTNLGSSIPDLFTGDDDQVKQRAIISEAFADDDIVEDFNAEKLGEIEKNTPKDIDLSLPGWGSWGGTNAPLNKRKKKRFTVKAPKVVPRRDDNKGALIINEDAQKKIKEHMVSELPFPFKTIQDFEASIRAPIGSTFVPQMAFRKLTRPEVTTKMGTVIEPMSRELLLNKNS